MKKTLFPLICGLLFSATAFAQDCIDVRAAFFAPCAQGEERVYLKGACQKSYEVESTYCSSASAPKCLDLRAADLAPCKNGEVRIYVQGKCQSRYQIEHTYCAAR